MIQQLTIQVVFVVYSFLFASFQVPAIKAMRDYVPINNPYHNPFHNRGLILSGFIAGILIEIYYPSLSLKTIELLFLLMGWYFLIFNGTIGILVYNSIFYLGTTAKLDAKEQEALKNKAGLKISIACTIIIIGLNTLLMRT